MPGQRSPLDESSHRPPTITSSPYDILCCMPIFKAVDSQKKLISRWYTIKVEADCPLKVDSEDSEEIFPFWEGELPNCSTFAAIAPDLYCFGGNRDFYPDRNPPVSAYACKLDVTAARPSTEWIPVMPMKYPRLDAHVFAVDGKFHVLAGDMTNSCSNGLELEVFDPLTQKWEEVPDDPPLPVGSKFISAALENPNRILVATKTAQCRRFSRTFMSTFYAYDVRRRSWEKHAERKVDARCPLGYSGRAVAAVGDTLYWLTDATMLLSYNLAQDLWLKGSLKGVGISFLDKYDDPYTPGFVHLENQMFCVLQCASSSELECVTVHVEPTSRKKLVISVVAIRKYVTELPTHVSKCLSL